MGRHRQATEKKHKRDGRAISLGFVHDQVHHPLVEVIDMELLCKALERDWVSGEGREKVKVAARGGAGRSA